MKQEIQLTVNGKARRVHVEPDTPLLYVLRNDLGLRGAKFGCGLEQCGSCRIIVDGESVPACRIPVRSMQGRSIVTVEGLGTTEQPHPLQTAFAEEQAVQCGFCVPGMIVTAKALLDRNPHPTEGEIKAALAYNLCRCGVHDRAVRAVQRVAGGEVPRAAFEIRNPETVSGEMFQGGDLPYPLHHTSELDSWIRINSDETVTVFVGKVELGQGIKTALGQIAAEELDVSMGRVQMVTADTALTPDEGYTAGSMSMETTGNVVRIAAAEARHILLSVAYEELEVPLERLVVQDGVVRDPDTGRSTTYWKLFGGKKFGVKVSGTAEQKSPQLYQTVGQPVPRIDLLGKVTGEACFVQDMALPGMLHGRVLRPPTYGARLASLDEEKLTALPGVFKVVRDGTFLGVIAAREEQAVNALSALEAAATWTYKAYMPLEEDLFMDMLEGPTLSALVVDGTPVDDPIPSVEAPSGAAQTLTATFTRPYQMHGAIGPSAAVAHLVDGELKVWSHTQGVYPLRRSLAHVLEMPEEKIRVTHVEGPGCYGHNGADDAALDAALLARAVPGQPVSLKWMRADEHAWEPYGPAMQVKMQASLDKDGKVIDWNHDVWSYSHLGRPRPGGDKSGLLAAWHLAEPCQMPELIPSSTKHTAEHRNADPLYDFPRRRIVKHFLPESPLRTSALRSLGTFTNVFALESFMDEMAFAAGVDPLDFRLRSLCDDRARAVLETAAEKAGWAERASLPEGFGRGLAFAQYKNRASYSAVVVDLSVDRESGLVRLHRAVIAADAGQVVNPDHLSSQLSGSFIQAASMTLKEQVRYDQYGITSLDWYSYPIMRFPESPQIEVILLDRPGQPYLGSGEAGPGPVPGAIANAIFDAVGVRLRQIPFLPEKVKAALR